MGDDVPNGSSVGVIALNTPSPCVPDLDRTVFGAGNHPFALTMEGYTGDIASMAIKREHGAWVCRAYIVELDVMVSGCGKVSLVWRDA